MGRHALSKTKQKAINSKFQDYWIEVAAKRYREVKVEGGCKGVRTVCREVEEECYTRTKKRIKLAKNTIQRQDVVVEFAIETAIRGFPLNHCRLKEHVNSICHAKLGERFPQTGVGVQWTYRFVERHWERLRPYWAHALDNSRARAVNPHTKEAYFALLKKVLDGDEGEEEIQPECIYGMDETGLQLGVGVAERVIGPAGANVQYQQGSGNRENITVLVTICADGTSTPPAVIYKSEAFHTSWKQDNPLNASLGYSKKGYTDGEIGVAWIKQFDNQTRAKAAGRRRLLLVDGHVSHYTFDFLDYARQNHIHILCYPSHSTHVYQGLDVVIFSVLKREWTTARGTFERQGRKVDKSNFLSVYAEAHMKSLTPENIRKAFKKTGVVPFNPDVVTSAMMAPSVETSTRAPLPLPQASPVRAVAALLMQ
ncbi:DDE-domain-containing protein, partial [Lentinus tigrinus ALCF2SS1-7]|uniref:DDE-domain-containing protein n=1 Tax=Lentinus tigrinus ALCF2SS1-7 TaxID=1328758 RepID=UPI0011662E51